MKELSEDITFEYNCNKLIRPKGNRAERRKDIKAFKKFRDSKRIVNTEDSDNYLYDLREQMKGVK